MVVGGSVVAGVGSGVVVLSAESILDVETRVVPMLELDIDVGFEVEVTKVVGGLETIELRTEFASELDGSVVDEAAENDGVLAAAEVVIVFQVEVPENVDNEADRDFVVELIPVEAKDNDDAFGEHEPWIPKG